MITVSFQCNLHFLFGFKDFEIQLLNHVISKTVLKKRFICIFTLYKQYLSDMDSFTLSFAKSWSFTEKELMIQFQVNFYPRGIIDH